jgi:hypothetical protein
MTAETIEVGSPKLRVYRILDEDRLTEAFKDANLRHEGGTLPYVDGDRARDVELTEEIMETTVGAALVDQQGEIVAEFEGKDAVRKAEMARKTARITFSLDIPEKPKRNRRQEVEATVAVADAEDGDDAGDDAGGDDPAFSG